MGLTLLSLSDAMVVLGRLGVGPRIPHTPCYSN